MAFNPTGIAAEYHLLVDVSLDGTTLRYADEDIAVLASNTVGYFYEGRVMPGGPIIRTLGSIIEPRERIETFQLQLDNSDDVVAGLLLDYTWPNREVTVRFGTGEVLADYSVIFPGVVALPNGAQWDERVATVTVLDRRVKDRRNLPPRTFTTNEYPNLENKSRAVPIPIVYGDWRSTAEHPLTVPAHCYDHAGKRFKVADHGLLQIEGVLKNAVNLSLSTQVENICLTHATFNLTGGVTYDATNDTVSVYCQGMKTANGTLIETPAQIYRSLYTTWCGLTGYHLNGTALHDLDNEVEYKLRRQIPVVTSTEALIGELLNESQADGRFVNGQYSPKFRSLDLQSDRTEIDESDIVSQDSPDGEQAHFSVEYDPERNYCNRCVARYAYSPVDAVFTDALAANLTTEQHNVCTTITRDWDMNWHYRDADVETRVYRELMEHGNNAISVDLLLSNRALLRNLADQIDLTFSVFSDRPMRIRHLELDPFDAVLRTRVADLIGISNMGHWTDDAAPTWPNSSLEERTQNGFWATDLGYAVSGNATSLQISRWY